MFSSKYVTTLIDNDIEWIDLSEELNFRLPARNKFSTAYIVSLTRVIVTICCHFIFKV